MKPEHRPSPRDAAPLAYSVREACRTLGIGKTSLYEEIKAGRLRAVKAGARTLIPADALHSWLDALEPAVA